MIENIIRTCGNVDDGVAWLLSALVNSYCDQIRSIGIRCVDIYIHATSNGPDVPLSFSLENVSRQDPYPKTINGPGTLQGKPIFLISNVSQSLQNFSDRKDSTSSGVHARSKLTPRVVFKLIWHLLKSHRYRIGAYTQTALVGMVFNKEKDFLSTDVLTKHLIVTDTSLPHITKVDFDWVKSMMSKSSFGVTENVRDVLSTNTILRALRFLPLEYSTCWLSYLVELCKSSEMATSTIASCSDWQPSLFEFISEILENMTPTILPNGANAEESESCQSVPPKGSNEGFDRSLELYSILFGYIVRNKGEKVCVAGGHIFQFF